MDTIFLKSKNSKTSDLQRLSLSLTDKINLTKSDKYLALQTLAFTVHRKIWKSNKN